MKLIFMKIMHNIIKSRIRYFPYELFTKSNKIHQSNYKCGYALIAAANTQKPCKF